MSHLEVDRLSGTETAGSISPTQTLAILAVPSTWLSSAASSNASFLTLPGKRSTFLDDSGR